MLEYFTTDTIHKKLHLELKLLTSIPTSFV